MVPQSGVTGLACLQLAIEIEWTDLLCAGEPALKEAVATQMDLLETREVPLIEMDVTKEKIAMMARKAIEVATTSTPVVVRCEETLGTVIELALCRETMESALQ